MKLYPGTIKAMTDNPEPNFATAYFKADKARQEREKNRVDAEYKSKTLEYQKAQIQKMLDDAQAKKDKSANDDVIAALASEIYGMPDGDAKTAKVQEYLAAGGDLGKLDLPDAEEQKARATWNKPISVDGVPHIQAMTYDEHGNEVTYGDSYRRHKPASSDSPSENFKIVYRRNKDGGWEPLKSFRADSSELSKYENSEDYMILKAPQASGSLESMGMGVPLTKKSQSDSWEEQIENTVMLEEAMALNKTASELKEGLQGWKQGTVSLWETTVGQFFPSSTDTVADWINAASPSEIKKFQFDAKKVISDSVRLITPEEGARITKEEFDHANNTLKLIDTSTTAKHIEAVMPQLIRVRLIAGLVESMKRGETPVIDMSNEDDVHQLGESLVNSSVPLDDAKEIVRRMTLVQYELTALRNEAR